MDLERSGMVAAGSAPGDAPINGNSRVWLESVSAGMRTVEAVIRELSQNDVPVLVVAEHGSGKAAAAARIHLLSSRASSRFQALLGRDVSAATLAASKAHGGTIYIQEVGDLTMAAQKELAPPIGFNWAEQPRRAGGPS